MSAADDLVVGITNALAAQDVKAAVDILDCLSRIDIVRASEVLDSMQFGIALRGVGFLPRLPAGSETER